MKETNNLIQWRTLEFEPHSVSRSFYIGSSLFLLATIIYALSSNSPIMAITFILIGIMGFITLEKEPIMLHCAINKDGIIVNRDLYAFENIESFWLVYEEDEKHISLRTSGKLTPFVHIPFGTENPVALREILTKYAKEEKHETTLIDTIEKMIHIR